MSDMRISPVVVLLAMLLLPPTVLCAIPVVSGMVGLGDLPGAAEDSRASRVSADGSVVVGYSYGAAGHEAFRWTQAGGIA